MAAPPNQYVPTSELRTSSGKATVEEDLDQRGREREREQKAHEPLSAPH